MNFNSYFELYLKQGVLDFVNSHVEESVNKVNVDSIFIEDREGLEFKCYVILTINDSYKYTVECDGDLEKLDNLFKIVGLKKYEEPTFDYILDSNFVPILNKKQLDFVSNMFLKKYYPEACLEKYIDVDLLIKNMGLSVKNKKLSLDGSIFGLISFKTVDVSYYTNNTKRVQKAKPGTIYIDNDATNNYAGKLTSNFAIVHECIHWYLHRKYFAFRDLVSSKVTNKKKKINLSWMEYQANEIASRVLLPECLLKKEFLGLTKSINNECELLLMEEQCIRKISIKANVSKEAVKVRLLKLGYNVSGLSEYMDGKYLKPYRSNKHLKYGESYSITFRNLLILAMTDSNLRELLSTNHYVFVDNHLCFKNSKYTFLKDHKFELTNYALEHIDECCILFLYDIDNKYEYVNNYDYILCKTQTQKKKIKIRSFETIDDIKLHPEKFGEYYNKVLNVCDSSPYNFREKLRYLRESVGMTREKLEEQSYISAQTIKEIENNNKRGYLLETIMLLCIGMKLPPEFSFDLLRSAGFNIEVYDNQKNCLYCYILRNLYDCGIDYVNEILKINNISPLMQTKDIVSIAR